MADSDEQKRIEAEVTAQVNERMEEFYRTLGTTIGGMKQQTDAVGKSTNMQNANRLAIEQHNAAMAELKKATASSVDSMKQLGTAFVSTEKGFTKFSGSLNSLGDAMSNLGSMIGGKLGVAVAVLGKGVTAAAEAALKQADNTLKATDQLSQLGGAGAFTAENVRQMGKAAGLTSANLEVFTKAAAKANTGLAGLGSTVAEGMTNFSKMTAVTSEQRQAFQRLGVSQEALMEQQADYVKLQEMSGKSLAAQAKDGNTLRTQSLEYAENLARLSALTGKSADKLQKEQEAAMLEYEEIVATRIEDDKIRKLKKEGRIAEAEALENEQKSRKAYITQVTSTLGKEAGLQVGKIARTGAFDSSTAGLAALGVNPGDIQSAIKGAKSEDEARRAASGFSQSFKELQSAQLGRFGGALQFMGEKGGAAVGLGKESLQETGRLMGRNEIAAYEAAKRQIASSTTAEDPAQIARNKLTETEIVAKQKLDDMVAAMNPLLSGWNALTIASTALTAAAGLAAAALTAMALRAKVTDIAGGAKGAGGGGGMGAKGIGGLAIGGMALGAAGDYATSKGHAKTGTALNIAGSAASGAAMGAMLGPIGAAVGGVLGAGYGVYQNWGAITAKSPSDLLSFTGKTGSEENFNQLDPELKQRVIAAAEEYNAVTGKKLIVNSAKRDAEDQKRLYDETVAAGRPGRGPTGMAVGKPGRSFHERGQAIDIQQGTGDPAAISALNKQGLVQTVAGDPVHFQLPMMASGGIVSSATVAMIGEGSNPELVAPFDPSSLLAKMLMAPASEVAQQMGASDSAAMMESMMAMMSQKFDDMITALHNGNDISDKILKYSKV